MIRLRDAKTSFEIYQKAVEMKGGRVFVEWTFDTKNCLILRLILYQQYLLIILIILTIDLNCLLPFFRMISMKHPSTILWSSKGGEFNVLCAASVMDFVSFSLLLSVPSNKYYVRLNLNVAFIIELWSVLWKLLYFSNEIIFILFVEGVIHVR